MAKKVTKTSTKRPKRTVGAKANKRASAKKTAKPAKTNNNGKIPLKRICQELGIDDKPARVKLRKLKSEGKLQWHEHSSRWEFTEKQAETVKELLAA